MKSLYPFYLLLFLLFASCVREVGDAADEEEPEKEMPETPVPLTNLLLNGNCEKWSSLFAMYKGDYLEYWSLEEHKGTVFRESEIVYEGNHSAKLCSHTPGITAFIKQTVDVVPTHRIRIFFRYRMEQTSGNGAKMHCYLKKSRSKNIPNDILSTYYDDATWQIIRGGGEGISRFSDTEGEWKTFDYVITVPAIAHCFVFEIHSYAGSVFYVDDCYVVDLDI